jgi:hypothetical protein
MLLAQVVTNIDWNIVYNSIVLSIIAISQIYLDFAIISSQRKAARERKIALAKERAEAEAALKQASRDSTI